MRSMRASRPRTKAPEERREELLNAAERLFISQGVDATTVEQITAATDTAKGTFYLYFASKEEIRSALGERFGHRLCAKIQSAVESQPVDDWRGGLAAWAETCVEGYLESLQLHDALFYSSMIPSRKGGTDNVVVDDLIELLEAGAQAGAWAIEDPRTTAVFLFSGLHGLVADEQLAAIEPGQLASRAKRLAFAVLGQQSN